jgi:hypothetical protein
VAEDSEVTVEQQDPPSETDTDATAADDTTENTPEPQEPAIDYEKRYKDAQRELARQRDLRRAAEDRIIELKEHGDPDKVPEDETPRERAYRLELAEVRRQRETADLAELKAAVGKDAFEAFEEFEHGVKLDPSRKGIANAFYAAVSMWSARAEQEPAKPKPAARTRAQAALPSNRQAEPSPDLDKAKREAVEQRSPEARLNFLDRLLR